MNRITQQDTVFYCVMIFVELNLKVQLRWAGHVARMGDIMTPKVVFFGEFQEEKRDRGAKVLQKDQMKRQLAQAGISFISVMVAGGLKQRQLTLISQKASDSETESHKAATERKKREQAASQTFPVRAFACQKCSRVCLPRFGLYSHNGC